MMHLSMIFDPNACIYDAANLSPTDGRTDKPILGVGYRHHIYMYHIFLHHAYMHHVSIMYASILHVSKMIVSMMHVSRMYVSMMHVSMIRIPDACFKDA